jgi:leader peptidase (prepilin peptidase)/N-methyltransferase
VESIASGLAERRGLTLEHARQWMNHVGLVAPLDGVEGEADLVAATRTALEDGVRELADNIRTSLNFFRTQDAAAPVELGVVTGPAVSIPGFVERLGEALRLPLETRVVESNARKPPVHSVRHTARAMSVGVAAVVAGILGAIIGSFLNVVAYRLPRKESLMSPPSACPSCGTPIKPYDNVPVLGWLWLRGRCRACGASISIRYPLVELGTGLLYAGCVLAFGADSDVWLPLVFVTLLVPITLIDLDYHIIPNVLSGIGAVAAIVLVLAFDSDAIVSHLIAALAAGGFFLLAAIVYPAGMGMGDVKLAAVMGLFLGRAVAPAIFAALIAGTVVGGLVMARFGMQEGRKKGIPFGPWLAFGSLVGLFVGDDLVDWYLDTFA